MERRLLEHVKVLAGYFPFVVEHAGTCHELKGFGFPPELHSIFHAPTITEVLLAIVIVDELSSYLCHAHPPRCILLSSAFGVVEHLVAGTSEAENSKVFVHNNLSGRLYLAAAVACIG